MSIRSAVLLFACSSIFLTCTEYKNTEPGPNIIYILIDDLGYADLGCYGSTVNSTPSIDRLSLEGMRFTDFHSNGPMCTPTRAALMTGMYQHRFGKIFEGPLSGKTQRNQGLPLEALTIAEVMKTAGYVTGMYGKWHLGYEPPFLPSEQGFDDFRGLGSGDGDHHTQINRWGAEDWWHNNQLEMESGYTTDLINDHSIEFIKKNKNKSFFLYVSHLAVHFPWQGPEDPPHRQKGNDYTNDKWGVIPDPGNVSPHMESMLAAVDEGVGKILRTLEILNLKEKTLIVLASDNGGYIHYNHQFRRISNNGQLRGQKGEVYEGGHRVPCIAWWPGKIKAGSTSDQVIMSMDMFPTFVHLANADISEDHLLDGIDVSQVFFENRPLSTRALFWKIDEEKAIRNGRWKLCLLGDDRPQLFDLNKDMGETVDVSDQHPEVVQSLLADYENWEIDVTSTY